MNKEIKEILNKLKNKNNYISHSMILLSDKETKEILDCITNLKQENKRLKKMVDWNDKVATNKQLIIDKVIKKIDNVGESCTTQIFYVREFLNDIRSTLKGSDE